MPGWSERCRRLWREESAPTATEYAVMLALIIVVAIVAITLFGSRVSASWSGSVQTIYDATGGS